MRVVKRDLKNISKVIPRVEKLERLSKGYG